MININNINIMHLVVTEKTIDFVSNSIIVEGEPLMEKNGWELKFSKSVIVKGDPLVEKIWWELKFSMIITLAFIDKAIFDDQGMIYDDFWIAERRVMKKNNDCRKTW